MSAYTLTIAIPTFNRPEQLGKTLSIVLPQVIAHDNVQLLILDNASPVPALDVLLHVAGLDSLPPRIKVIRHRVNIGGNANILRCFEVAEGDWLWCLSDDDCPSAHAVEYILADCETGGFCYCYYGLNPEVPKLDDCNGRFMGRGVADFVKRIPRYGHRLFISEAVFNLSVVCRYLTEAYAVVNSGAPHLVMAFLAITNGESYLLSNKQIAAYNVPAVGTGYNCVPLSYGTLALYSFVGPLCSVKDFEIFFAQAFYDWLSPYLLLRQMILLHREATGRFIHKQFTSIANMFKPSFFKEPQSWARWSICQGLSFCPDLFVRLFAFRARLSHRCVNNVDGRVE